jgi:hypothetical protein
LPDDVSEFIILKNGRRHIRHWKSGQYEFKLKSLPGIPPDIARVAPDMPKTKALLASMTTGREAGKGSGKAASQMVEPTFVVWLDQTEHSCMLEVPDRIRFEKLVTEVGRELGTDLGNPLTWQLWKGDQPAMPPLINGEECGLVPADIPASVSQEPLTKSQIEFISQIRRHGRMVPAMVSVLGVQHRQKIPPEVTLSQLIRRHPTVSTLPPETIFSRARITTGSPGRRHRGNQGRNLRRFFVYVGFGQFAEPFEMDVVERGEAELLAEANRLNPRIGTTPQYFQGAQKLPNWAPVRELLIFPQEIERSSMDSPTGTGVTAERMRMVGPLKTITWSLVDKKGKGVSPACDAVIPEDVLLLRLWLECVKEKLPTVESPEIDWGKQTRNGVDIGHGMPLVIQYGDRLHIKVKTAKKAPAGGKKQVVEYVVGAKSFQATMKSGDSIEKLLNEIRKVCKSLAVERIRLEDSELMMSQTLNEITGKKVIVVVSPLVEVILLFKGTERRFVATSSWNREQFAGAARAAVGSRGDKATVRRIGGEEDPWEVRAGHTYELVETIQMTIKVLRDGQKTLDVKVAGPDSIGDVAAKITRQLKLPPWEQVRLRRSDGKAFWLENGGKYVILQEYDEEADTRLKLSVRYDAPDRTFIVEQVRFDASKDLNHPFVDLRKRGACD